MVYFLTGLWIGLAAGMIVMALAAASARSDECADCQARMIRQMQPIVGVQKENERLRQMLAELRKYSSELQEAFNAGDGSYHP